MRALKSWWPNESESLKSHWLLCLFDLDWYLYNALCTQNKEHCDRNSPEEFLQAPVMRDISWTIKLQVLGKQIVRTIFILLSVAVFHKSQF